jgi:hypothetical protein
MIRTSKQDIYNALVERAGEDEEDDEDEDSSGAEGEAQPEAPSEFLFDYQYELFSLGLVVGFLNNQPDDLEVTDDKGQDILRVGTLSESNQHRQTIEFVHQIAKMELPVEPPEDVDEIDEWLSSVAWDNVLEYADEGVVQIQSEMEVQEDFDFLRIITELDSEVWEERLRSALADHIQN